jgi:3-deoxy-D-manno-octulosonic acid kinase
MFDTAVYLKKDYNTVLVYRKGLLFSRSPLELFMSETKKIKLTRDIFLVNNDYCPEFEPNMFDSYYWANKNLIFGTAKGRGVTYFVGNKRKYVLRHYLRGGFIANFSKDSFFYQGKKSARSLQEFLVLELLRSRGMNVPVPVAARTHRSGIWWAKYDILVSYIENSSNLVNILKQRTLSSNEIAEIAKSVIQLAANGVYHSDLNIHNLLIDDQGRIWIIDFDKSKLIPNGCVERMLERLHRSFAKERRLALEAKESFFFTDDVFDSIKTQVMQGLSASKR